MNKRGFELVWSTVVVIVLALMLLLFIILFFTSSSGSFMEKIKSYFSYSNVDSVVSGCNILVDVGNEYSFCCEKKMVKYYADGEKLQGEFSCDEITEQNFGNEVNQMSCGGITC